MADSRLQGGDVTIYDRTSIAIGLRTAEFTADAGFQLNAQRVVLRGFSNHNDMAGVGAAVPTRLNLYRAQMLRAVGGNTWRMSHNPGARASTSCWDPVPPRSSALHNCPTPHTPCWVLGGRACVRVEC